MATQFLRVPVFFTFAIAGMCERTHICLCIHIHSKYPYLYPSPCLSMCPSASIPFSVPVHIHEYIYTDKAADAGNLGDIIRHT